MPGNTKETKDRDAMAIYQDHVDRASAATLAADYAAFSACISFPWRVRTVNLDLCIEDDEEHRRNFRQFVDVLKTDNVTGLHRLVKTAWFVTPDVIEGTHISHMMHNGTRLRDPYYNRIRLVRHPEHGWRETDCTNAVVNKAGNFAIVDTISTDALPPELKELPERKLK